MTLLLNRLFMHLTDNYSDVIVYYLRHVITSIAYDTYEEQILQLQFMNL